MVTTVVVYHNNFVNFVVSDRLELRSQSIIHPDQHGIHGIIPENAQPGDEVILDPPLEVLHKKEDQSKL